MTTEPCPIVIVELARAAEALAADLAPDDQYARYAAARAFAAGLVDGATQGEEMKSRVSYSSHQERQAYAAGCARGADARRTTRTGAR